MTRNAITEAAPPTTGLAAALSGSRTVTIEKEALERLADKLSHGELGKQFSDSIDLISSARGRVVVSGMGKSGLIARKIAATLASTGTPSFFIHPADAGHGDLGMITADDVMILLSWSGETSELSDIVTYCQRFAVPMISMTSAPASTLAQKSQHVLVLPQVRGACPNELAPTSSTAMQLALGDALAVALIEMRGFSPADFRIFHPKGQLGSKLLSVGDIMNTGSQVPRVGEQATILEAVLQMTSKRFGATAVVDRAGRLVGSFTDGDLRRSLGSTGPESLVVEFMSRTPLYTAPTILASEALALMNKRQISQLFVCEHEAVVGIIHLHDILRANVV